MKKRLEIRCVFLLMTMLSILVGGSYSANVNTLSIIPSTYTGRYFCPINLAVTANYNGSEFSNCQYGLKFELSDMILGYKSRGNGFSLTDRAELSNNILYVEEQNSAAITNTEICSYLVLTGINVGAKSGTLRFVTINGNYPTAADFIDTTDKLNLSFGGDDTLTGVQDLTINFEACPCELDNDKPVITGRSINGSVYNATTHYVGTQTIKVLVYDKGGTSRGYWTHGTKNLANYTGGAPTGMDNQEGINSGTIVVEIYSGGTVIQTLTGGNGLTVTAYTGNSNTPRYTWDGNDRGYRVSFNTNSLSIETPVTINISVYDNALNGSGDCKTTVHSSKAAITLNQKRPPIITFNSPTGNNVNPNTGVKLTVSDERAGINTGSLVVEILPVMSGGQLIMSGSVYSGSDLSFQLIAGSGVLGGASKYEVTFQPRYEFAVSTGITLSGYVEDLVGMTGQKTHQFKTRADCTFYGCVNFVDIFSGSLSNLIQPQFTGSLIVVTGTVLPYPYLTGASGDIVMCGPVDRSIKLGGNIDIYSGSERINGSVYPYEELYVTGLDFEYHSGVITPIY